MLNYLWAFMILIGVVFAAFTGRMDQVTEAAIESAKEAVELCIMLAGVVAMWMGLMKIAEVAGLIKSLARKMRPILRFLFPKVPDDHPAQHYIATNIIANMLGLGWGATPPGLKAMEELQKLNKDKHTASTAMCTFLVINISSVQLISVNILAYRAKYGSKNPAEIIGPSILATIVSTLVGVIFVKIMMKVGKR